MIPQDDFIQNQKPHILPFLELDVIVANDLRQLEKNYEWLKSVEMKGTPGSPSPTPPVSPRSNKTVEKKGFKSFIKDLAGSHGKKKDRDALMLEFAASEMPGRSAFQLKEFLESILDYDEATNILNQNQSFLAIRDVWAQLQEDADTLPALWMSDWNEEDVDTKKQREKTSSLTVFPRNLRWQYVAPALPKLPLLLDLLKAVMEAAGQWKMSFNHFAQCTCDAFLEYARDEECQALIEFLVCNCPTPQYKKFQEGYTTKTIVPFEEAILKLFLRCWSSQVVFNFSTDFWGSPWWQVLESTPEFKSRLLPVLAKAVVDWNILQKPLPKDQVKAMGDWLKMFDSMEMTSKLKRRWERRKWALMQVGGNGMMQDLQGLLQLNDESAKPSDDYNWDEADAEEQAKGLCWCVRGWVKGNELNKDDLADLLEILRIFKNTQGKGYFLTYFWRCFLLDVLPLNGRTDEQTKLAKTLILELMPENMSSQDVKLLCLCLPWLPAAMAQDVADALRAKISTKNSPLMVTICATSGLRQMVALQLAIYSRVAKSGLSLKDLFDAKRLQSEGCTVYSPNWESCSLVMHLTYSSLIFSVDGGALKRLPKDVEDHISAWFETLPPVAKKCTTAVTLNEWIVWLGNQEAVNSLIKTSGIPTFLATLHILGCWIVKNMTSHGFNVSSVPDELVSALCAVVSEKWPRKYLVSEMVLCLLMPYASWVLQQNSNVDDLVYKLEMLQVDLASSLAGVSLDGMREYDAHQLKSNREHLFAVIREIPRCLDHTDKIDTQHVTPSGADIEAAYSLVARVCLGRHLGASEERLELSKLQLQLATFAMQKQRDTSFVLSSLLLASKRTAPEAWW